MSVREREREREREGEGVAVCCETRRCSVSEWRGVYLGYKLTETSFLVGSLTYSPPDRGSSNFNLPKFPSQNDIAASTTSDNMVEH